MIFNLMVLYVLKIEKCKFYIKRLLLFFERFIHTY